MGASRCHRRYLRGCCCSWVRTRPLRDSTRCTVAREGADSSPRPDSSWEIRRAPHRECRRRSSQISASTSAERRVGLFRGRRRTAQMTSAQVISPRQGLSREGARAALWRRHKALDPGGHDQVTCRAATAFASGPPDTRPETQPISLIAAASGRTRCCLSKSERHRAAAHDINPGVQQAAAGPPSRHFHTRHGHHGGATTVCLRRIIARYAPGGAPQNGSPPGAGSSTCPGAVCTVPGRPTPSDSYRCSRQLLAPHFLAR